MAYGLPIIGMGAKDKTENYRQISLTSIAYFLIETSIKESIMAYT